MEPYWDAEIAPRLKAGEDVLIAAHGNSLRALVQYLDGIPNDEITELKKTLPADAEAAAGSAVAKQIDELAATRKELVAGKFKDKHANMGYLLLALGVTLAVEGGMNTYLRVGKLFPGPHLYAGASIVVLWAMAAGLVPQMEKGNQKARDLHIALNCINVALFTWQIPTGLEIVGKVFQFTSWP